MNGAIAEPPVVTTKMPNNPKMIIIGSSQNFLRTRRKAQNSLTKSIMSAAIRQLTRAILAEKAFAAQ